jgi:hypothetical protein
MSPLRIECRESVDPLDEKAHRALGGGCLYPVFTAAEGANDLRAAMPGFDVVVEPATGWMLIEAVRWAYHRPSAGYRARRCVSVTG